MAATAQKPISFSPPDITEEEISAVAEALRSGWITTGPRTKELERRLKDEWFDAAGVAAFGSATHSLEACLRIAGIGPGDEVIVPAYTYTASASPVCHVGATLVLCDVDEDTFDFDYDALGGLITPKTKAIIPVDLGGIPADYDQLFRVAREHADLWQPSTDIQRCFDRVMVIADCAHAVGARYHGKPCGCVADFSSFSFHAVKNLTTAEGGALAWRDFGYDSDEIYRQCMLQALHGQSKDALSKSKAGAWEYDVVFPGYKSNMTDIMASIGLVQLKRYPGLLARRRELIARYEANLADAPVLLREHYTDAYQGSGHLMITRVQGATAEQRNDIITRMAEEGVATNVHYKPLPLLTAYANLGFKIEDFPVAYRLFANEVTLPLHTLLTDEDVDRVCDAYKRAIAAVMGN